MGHGQAEGQSGDLESQNLSGKSNSQGRIWLLTPWDEEPRNSVILPHCDVLVPKQIRFCDS